MIKNIAVIGTGGVGGFFGGKLCSQTKADGNRHLSFLARGEHLREMKERGLTLKTRDEGIIRCRPDLITDSIDDIPSPDLCLLCVKAYDLEEVLRGLRDKIQDTTLILPLLNGVDIEQRIRKVVPNGILLPACVYGGTRIEAPGVVTQTGGSCEILFGESEGSPPWPKEELFRLFRERAIRYHWVEDATPEIWKKFLFIASFGLVTACYNRSIGEVLTFEDLSHMVKDVMAEIFILSQALSVSLPVGTPDELFRKGAEFPYETKTSFQRDFEERNHRDERDIFGNTILHLCREEGIPCPITAQICARLEELKPLS